MSNDNCFSSQKVCNRFANCLISCGIPAKALVRLEPCSLIEFRHVRALAVPKAQQCYEDGKKVSLRSVAGMHKTSDSQIHISVAEAEQVTCWHCY